MTAARRARPALALLLAACVPGLRSSFREGQPLATERFDAAGLTALDLDARVGDVELRPASSDSVEVEVTLRSSDADRLARECLPRSSLDVRRDGTALVVRLTQRTRNQCGTRWRVALPPRLHARVQASVGDVTSVGLAGGMDVTVGTGDVDVRSRAASHGRVEVSSDVGRVSLRVRGYDVPAERRQGAGQQATLRGPSGPDVVLRTRVGRAALVIEDGR